MSSVILYWSVLLSQFLLALAMILAARRLVMGPRAQDRIMGLDTLYVLMMMIIMLFGVRSNTTIYFEAALVIGSLGFISSIALAKFLMRGEVIE